MLDVSVFKHFRINHSKLFAYKGNHIDGIENFRTLSQSEYVYISDREAKLHMRKFNGVPKHHLVCF